MQVDTGLLKMNDTRIHKLRHEYFSTSRRKMSTKKEIEGPTHIKPGVAYILLLLLLLLLMMMIIIIIMINKGMEFHKAHTFY
jgi:hypothetical protein